MILLAARAMLPRDLPSGGEIAPACPALAAAVDAGRLDDDHVRTVLSTLRRLPDVLAPDVVAQAETTLVEHAMQHDATQFRTIARHLETVLNPDGAPPDNSAAHTKVEFGVGQRSIATGLTRISGWLDDLGIATLRAVINPLAAPKPEVDGIKDRRSPANRRAHALIEQASGKAMPAAVIGQHGDAGPLAGQSIVSQLSRLLSSISTFSTDGQIGGLKSIGLDLQTNGHLTYTPFQFMAADIMSSISVTSFLGSATGGGFLKNATDIMSKIEDPTIGLLKNSAADLNAQITRVTDTIAKKQSQVDALQIRLQNQMAVSDALIAAMEQKASYFSTMFAAQETANRMYQ